MGGESMNVKPASTSSGEPFTIGLDIGIASVGWAILGESRIIDLGVRCFDKAETAKEGESLNLSRRTARLMRRRLRRRAWRLTMLSRFLKREGLIADVNILKQPPQKGFKTPNLWQLRVEALDRKLTNEEWARVIYHLCKHRGFHWISKAEAKAADNDKEGGKVKQGLAGTKRLMQEKNYRTAAEMVLTEFPDAQRNKQGEYSKALSRDLLCEELKELFKQQRSFGNPHTGEKLEIRILGNGDKKSGLFWAQKPSLSGEALLKMLGKCTFEKDEYRAPKASFTAERHVLLTRINNLRLVEDGKIRGLTPDERRIALWQPYQQVGDFKYKQLGSALVKAGLLVKNGYKFAGLSYPSKVQKAEKAKDPENTVLVKLPAWQELRKVFKDVGMEHEWQEMADPALNGKPELLDQIGWVLSVYKEDDEVERELSKLDLPNKHKMIDALQTVHFDKFNNLSLAALYKIVPEMEKGLRYDEACVEAGYHHSMPDLADDKARAKHLPPFYSGRDKHGRLVFNEDMDIPRNPVVLRALNQARKVVNALIQKYGSPHEVHIEMARDLSKPLKERKDISTAQEKYRKQTEKLREDFKETFKRSPEGSELEKWRFYREQNAKSPYSGIGFDIERLLEPGYVEIDHVLPFRRSFDNSRNNKVVCFASENRDKGNKTPYEYLDEENNSESWRQFVAFVDSTTSYRQAKRSRLLRKDFGEEEAKGFRDRNLNDTRYICRFFKNYVEKYLQLHEESGAKRCVVVSGSMTSLLRARWGLLKARGESDRHHALDAVVVAACGHWQVNFLSTYVRKEGWSFDAEQKAYVNTFTGEVMSAKEFTNQDDVRKVLSKPWPHFRQELLARLNIDDRDEMCAASKIFQTYTQEALDKLKPLFVSRAPKRRNSGAMHDATIRSSKNLSKGYSVIRLPLIKLTLEKLNDVVGADDKRNKPLIDLLESRLKAHDNNGKKAFAEPLYKPSSGKGPIVRSVKVKTRQKVGMKVRNGVSELGPMLRVNVYKRAQKHIIEPIYSADMSTLIQRTEVPEDAQFLFSLCKNEYVRIQIGKKSYFGYFVQFESDGRLTLRAHDQPIPDKKYFRKSVASAVSIEKFNVDVLGNIYLAPPEQRSDMA